MIKYFDFEKAVEQIDNKIKELQDSDDSENSKTIDKLNIEKKKYYYKNLFQFKFMAKSSNCQTS
tara:strand:+ start:30 stop:221 length:192 start_codon:yes stop_codon:yes gene_type:complete